MNNLSPNLIQALDLSRIPKLSSHHLDIVGALLQRYPLLGSNADSPPWLATLASELGEIPQLEFIGFSEKSAAEFIRELPIACVTAQLSIEPQEEKVLLNIDPKLSRSLVQRALGNSKAENLDLKPLTSTEQGILEFLLLKTIQSFEDHPGMLGPIALRVLKLATDPKMLLDLSSTDERGCIAKFYLRFQDQGGYIQFYLPHPLLEKVFLREDIVEGVFRPDQEDELETQLGRVSHLKTSLWTEVGRVNLSEGEKQQLEKGDVILFDETFAASSLHGITGKAILRVGENGQQGLLVELIDSQEKLILKILDFYGEEL